MPKDQISIKLDGETLARADKASAVLGWSRSALIERAIERYLQNLDSMVDEMSHENTVTAAVMDRIVSDPGLLRAVAKGIGADLDPKTVSLNAELQPRLRAEADRRKTDRKKSKKTRGETESG